MKRFLLAFLILATGTSVFCTVKTATARLRRQAISDDTAWKTETQLVLRSRTERTHLDQQVRDARRELASAQQIAVALSPKETFIPKPGQRLSSAQSERLLAAMGFNWKTTGDYVVVSKGTLQHIRLNGIDGMKLSKVACQVLAITPRERAAIDSLTQEIGTDYKSWAESHVQRAKPTGSIVAKYTLPADTNFTQRLADEFTSGVLTTLGQERGQLLLNYSQSWRVGLGMDHPGVAPGAPPGPTTMTIQRYGSADNFHLGLQVKQAGNTMETEVSPWQPMPEAFRPLFPGGWRELAKQEGFALPKSFKK